MVLDGAGRVQEHNPAAAELLGDIVSGEPWIDVVVRAFAPRWDDGHDISLKDGRLVNIATEALRGEPGQILLLKDVTETRRLQEQLNHHKRLSATTEMAAALAHQIRTPLASAMLHTSNLNRPKIDEQTRRRAAAKGVEAMRRLERLVEEMLLFARGGKLQAAPIVASDLLDRFARLAADSVSNCAFTVTTRLAVDDVVIRGNDDSLLSIMLNIVHNSRQAAGDTGALVVDAVCRDETLTVTFTDDGPGIPGGQHEQVFEPFWTTRKGGTGLGLAVARSVARAHGGDIVADTTHAGGARLVLRLPTVRQAAAEACAIDGVRQSPPSAWPNDTQRESIHE